MWDQDFILHCCLARVAGNFTLYTQLITSLRNAVYDDLTGVRSFILVEV